MLLSAVVLQWPPLAWADEQFLPSSSFAVNKCHFAGSVTTPLTISLSLFPIVTCKFQWLISLLFRTLNFQVCIFHPLVHNLFYILLHLPFIILEFYSWEKSSSCYPAPNTFVFPFHRLRNLGERLTGLLKVDNLKYSHVPLHKRRLCWCPSAEPTLCLLLRYPKAWLASGLGSRDGGILMARFPLLLDHETDWNKTFTIKQV